MHKQESKMLIKIGNYFEANASGNFAISVVLGIVIIVTIAGCFFL